jgi:hypothetical protein
MQADLHEAQERRDLALRKNEELGILAILAGNIQEAEQYCRRLPPESPEAGEGSRRLGRLCLEMGDRQKAVEQLVKAAKMHLEHKNYGLCRLALDECIAADPGHAEAAVVLAELKVRLEPPPPPPAPVEKAPAKSASRAEAEPAVEEKPAKGKEAAKAKEAPKPAEPVEEEKAASPHLTYDRQPFEPAKPLVTKVSGITAKLKKMKTSGPEEAGGPAKTIKTNVKNITAKLRLVKEVGGEGEAPATAPDAGPAPAPEAPPAPKKRGSTSIRKVEPSKLGTAASRLKLLAEKKSEEGSVPSGEGEADGEAAAMAALEAAGMGGGGPSAAPAPAEGPAVRVPIPQAASDPGAGASAAPLDSSKLGNFASRLAALRKSGGEAPAATAAPAPKAAARAASEEAPAENAAASSPEGSPGNAPPAANKKLKLNTSASKLAELRKKPVSAG